MIKGLKMRPPSYIKNSVVFIETKIEGVAYQGTGFFLRHGNDTFLVTCAHVIRKPKQHKVLEESCDNKFVIKKVQDLKYAESVHIFFNSKADEGLQKLEISSNDFKCFSDDKATDIAIAHIDFELKKLFDSFECLSTDTLSSHDIFEKEAIAEGDLVSSAGRLMNISIGDKVMPFFHFGYVSCVHRESHSIFIQMLVTDGFSGSPVFFVDHKNNQFTWIGHISGSFDSVSNSKDQTGITGITPAYKTVELITDILR